MHIAIEIANKEMTFSDAEITNQKICWFYFTKNHKRDNNKCKLKLNEYLVHWSYFSSEFLEYFYLSFTEQIKKCPL